MQKRIFLLLILFVFCCFVYARGVQELDTESITTEVEKKDGWNNFPDLGIAYKLYASKTSKLSLQKDISGIKSKKLPIYGRLDCIMYTDSLLDEYCKIIQDNNITGKKSLILFKSIVKQRSPILYSLVVIKTKALRKYSITDITKLPENYVLHKTKDFVHVFSTQHIDLSMFNTKEKDIYIKIRSTFDDILCNIKITQPNNIRSALHKIKYLNFNSFDLNNSMVDSTYFNKHNLTAVYYWNSREPMSRIKFIHIQNVLSQYTEENIAMLGIVSNINEEQEKELNYTKSFLKSIHSEFTNVQNTSSFLSFSKYLVKPDVLFFVNSKGRILPIVFDQYFSESDLQIAIQKLLR